MQRGKKWKASVEKVEKGKLYEPTDAVALAKDVSYTKFDGSLEVALKINYKALQNVRGILRLPHGNGKEVRVLVIAREDKHAEAKEAGAEFVGGMEMIDKIKSENWTDFDACVATPDMMKEVGKLGPILGRKGLMPKPKAGTVTDDVTLAIKNLKSGQVDYRPDKSGVIHLGIGRISFDDNKLEENLKSVYQAIMRDKPSDAKGEFIKSVYVAPTMGPAVKVSNRSLG